MVPPSSLLLNSLSCVSLSCVCRRRAPACMRCERSSDSVTCNSWQREPSDVCGHQGGDCKRGCRSSSGRNMGPKVLCNSEVINTSHSWTGSARSRRAAALRQLLRAQGATFGADEGALARRSATEDELAAEKAADPGLTRYNRSSARDRRVSRSPSICRASAPCPGAGALPLLRLDEVGEARRRTSLRRWR